MLAFKQNVFYFLELILSWDSPSSDCCVFDQQTHACPCARMVKNDEKHLKIMKKYLFHHAYERLMKKNKEKSLLVSDWEWIPKAGWHPNAGCSFRILFFFVLFSTWASHVHDTKCSLNYSKWATSIWESLPIADQQTLFFVFLHEPYMCLSYAWWKRYFFMIFK